MKWNRRSRGAIAALALLPNLHATSPDAVLGGFAAVTAIGAVSPSQKLEQIYYLGTYDPDNRVPPTFFRVRVNGQSSFLSGMTFGSGWVPAAIADSLGDAITTSGIAKGVSSLNSPLACSGASFLQYGPEGFRVVPDNNRLVIVMGSSLADF